MSKRSQSGLWQRVQADLVLLHFAGTAFFFFFFYRLKVGGDPASSKTIGTIFPMTFAHFMSLGDILVILAIFQNVIIIFIMGISDVTICKKITNH